MSNISLIDWIWIIVVIVASANGFFVGYSVAQAKYANELLKLINKIRTKPAKSKRISSQPKTKSQPKTRKNKRRT